MFACIFTFQQRGNMYSSGFSRETDRGGGMGVGVCTDWLVDFKELAGMIT